MKKMNYEKPIMKKIALFGKERVAAGNCWSVASSTGKDTWYYDYNEGETGYIVFKTYGNCGSWGELQIVPENAEGGQSAADWLTSWLNANGNPSGKQEFLDSGIITDDPSKVS